MVKAIGQNYYFDEDRKIFFRLISKKEHKLWSGDYIGLVAFNAELYNEYKNRAKIIGWRDVTEPIQKRYWKNIEGEDGFDFWKSEINFVEKQYTLIPLCSWECEIIN